MKRILIICILALGGCSEAMTKFPIHVEDQQELPGSVNVVRVSSKNIANFHKSYRSYSRTRMPASQPWAYKIGVGDVVSVTVFDHPELTLPQSSDATLNGFSVHADGTFYFPFIGDVQAEGKSVQEVRQEISQKLKSYVTDPQVDVRIAGFNSQSIVVSGEVNAPSKQHLTSVPLSLLEAVNAAGGWTDDADVSGVVLRRGGRSYHVDLRGFLEANMGRNNPVLIAGDVVHVPEKENQEAFVMGETLRNEVVDVSSEMVSLTEAVNTAGGPKSVRADARGVFVFRRDGATTNVYQFDTTSPEGWLLGAKFTLAPQDVVYITRSPLQRWNDTIARLLPTVNAIGAVDDLVADVDS